MKIINKDEIRKIKEKKLNLFTNCLDDSLKRNLLTNFLIMNILMNSVSYSSGMLYDSYLNSENNLTNEEDMLVQTHSHSSSIRPILERILQEYSEILVNFINDYDNQEIDYLKLRQHIEYRETLTSNQLDILLDYMCDINSNYYSFWFESEEKAIEYLYINQNRTYEEKMLIIMLREGLTYEELDTLCACVVTECGNNDYDEAYRVASVINNRINSNKFVSAYGESLYDQLTAPGQFQVYRSGAYQRYLGCTYMERYRAAIDAFYTGVSSIEYLSFRSSDYQSSEAVQYVSGGNNYFTPLTEDDRVTTQIPTSIEDSQIDNEVIAKTLNFRGN